MNDSTLDIDSVSELVAQCRAGEKLAWKRLFDAHFEFVERVSRRLGTPDAEVDDVVQETFVVAFAKLDAFEEGRLSTWLYRIAANIVAARHRRRRVRTALLTLFGRGDEPPVRAADHDYDAAEAQAEVAQVLARMPAKKREVFALYELDGMSGEEVAAHVGCKVETVWTRLHYARKEFERIARQRGLTNR